MSKSTSPKQVTVELIDFRESNYVMDGGNPDNPIGGPISYPSGRKLKNPWKEKWVDPSDNVTKLRTLRYIKGCDVLEVELQKQMGFVPNPANDAIWLNNGRTSVIERGGDVGLYRALVRHENNASNKNRPDGAEEIFREVILGEDNEEMESILDLQTEALVYLGKLKKKDTAKGVVYDEAALKFLCNLFQLPSFEEYKTDAWVELSHIARTDPAEFLSKINKSTALVESDVNQAFQKGVISYDDEKVYFTDGNVVLLPIKENLTKEEVVSNVVAFMLDGLNKKWYDTLRSRLVMIASANTDVLK